MGRRRVEVISRTLVGRLPALPRPWNVNVLCQRLAECRGRELLVHELDIPALPFGLWYYDGTRDHIVFRQGIAGYHRDHVVLHEVCHMLAGHNTIELHSATGQRDEHTSVEEDIAEAFASETLRSAWLSIQEPASEFETRTAATFGFR